MRSILSNWKRKYGTIYELLKYIKIMNIYKQFNKKLMKCFWLLFFIPFVSFSDNQLSEADITFLPDKKAINSLVRVVIDNPQNRLSINAQNKPPHLLETVGFIAKDSKGDIGVITGFNIFNMAVHIDMERSLMVYNSVDHKFTVKAIKSISPVDNLIFFTVKGDLTENGDIPPLPLAHFRTDNEPEFYTSKVLSGNDFHLKTRKVQKTVSFADRLDFLISDIYTKNIQPTETHTPVINQTPILNHKGEVLSFVFDGSEHTLYGTPLQDLQKLLNSSEYCSPFIRGCVIKARKELYRKAQEDKDSRAIYALIFLTYEFRKSFENFMHSIGIQDPIQIKREQEFFWKEATKWDIGLYHHWLTNNKNLSKSDRKKHLKFLEQTSSLKSLAQQGHPHFQYLLADIYFQLNDKDQALYWLNEASQSGYMPAVWKKMSLYFLENFSDLNNLAKQGYPPAQQLLGLINQDFKKFKSALNQYNQKKLKPYSPNKDHSQTDLNHSLSVPQRSTTPPFTETNSYYFSMHFSDTLINLQKGFDILETLAKQNYERAKIALSSFKENRTGKKLRLLFYPLSERLNQKCEEVFDKPFVSEN